MLRHPEAYANILNSVQKSWTAKAYPELKSMSYADLIRRAGGLKSRIGRSVSERIYMTFLLNKKTALSQIQFFKMIFNLYRTEIYNIYIYLICGQITFRFLKGFYF